MKKWSYALNIGFFAGAIWGLIGWSMTYFSFTKVRPSFLIEPFMLQTYTHSWRGYVVGLLAFIVFSMIAALLYTVVLRKAKGPWPGIAYGLLWYVLLFFILGPWLGMLPPYRELPFATHASEACRYVLWGVFIGYSITMEFTDERQRE